MVLLSLILTVAHITIQNPASILTMVLISYIHGTNLNELTHKIHILGPSEGLARHVFGAYACILYHAAGNWVVLERSQLSQLLPGCDDGRHAQLQGLVQPFHALFLSADNAESVEGGCFCKLGAVFCGHQSPTIWGPPLNLLLLLCVKELINRCKQWPSRLKVCSDSALST